MNDTTFDMFSTQYMWYAECSGLKTYGVEQMERIYADLVRTYIRACTSKLCTDSEIEQMESTMGAVTIDHEMRQAYRMGIFVPGAAR